MGFSGFYSTSPAGYHLDNYHPDPTEPLTFHSKAGQVIVIGERFETDGATVPRPFWSIPGLAPHDWPRAAILHDWLWELRYRSVPAIGFRESNRLLRQAIRCEGWPLVIAWLAWLGVTCFGWWFWYRGEIGRAHV